MKNLHQIDVHVGNDTERSIAIDFFKRACRKREVKLPGQYYYVGICTNGMAYEQNNVLCGIHTPNNEVVSFKNIKFLADSPSRKAALDLAFKRNGVSYKGKCNYTGKAVQGNIVSMKEKIPSKLLPVISFRYPSSKTGQMERRYVRVVKADTHDIIGYQLPLTNFDVKGTFKKFKRGRVQVGSTTLTKFNS